MKTFNVSTARLRLSATALGLISMLSAPAFALLPIPTRPTTFPLQRPTVVGELEVSGLYYKVGSGFSLDQAVDSRTEVPPGLTGVVQVATGDSGQQGIQFYFFLRKPV
jgi:hypothetical protein